MRAITGHSALMMPSLLDSLRQGQRCGYWIGAYPIIAGLHAWPPPQLDGRFLEPVSLRASRGALFHCHRNSVPRIRGIMYLTHTFDESILILKELDHEHSFRAPFP
jgi:hypothetical protein